jgi:hypothetical protein
MAVRRVVLGFIIAKSYNDRPDKSIIFNSGLDDPALFVDRLGDAEHAQHGGDSNKHTVFGKVHSGAYSTVREGGRRIA